MVFDEQYDPFNVLYGEDAYFQPFSGTDANSLKVDSLYASNGSLSIKVSVPPKGSALGVYAGGALDWLLVQVAAVQALHPHRAVILGETGWATSVHDQGEQAELIKGKPGENEQKIFHDAVRAWGASENQAGFFFEAFDENWKGGDHPDEVEKHWGLFRADRSGKQAVETRNHQ